MFSRQCFVFRNQIQRQLSLPPPEDQFALRLRPVSFSAFHDPVARNQQFVSVLVPEHFDAGDRRREHDRVIHVKSQGIRLQEPSKGLPLCAAEADIAPEFFHGSARFAPAKHVAVGCPLVFETDIRCAADPGLRKPFHCGRR
jgi:hypothetical protein